MDEESEDEKDLKTQMETDSGEGSTDKGKHHMNMSYTKKKLIAELWLFLSEIIQIF